MTTAARACPACHTPLPDEAHFCLHCGKATPTEPGVPSRTAATGVFEVERVRKALAGRGYTIDRVLGEGGMATVYLATDVKHRRQVAVKVMRPELAATLGAERFLREVEIAAQLSHPHILPVHDSGDADGVLFYVMPYVEGESLHGRIQRETQLPVDEALRLAREVSEALAYAHGRKIVHRDIKPANIMLSAGHALVADFGIARALGGGAAITQTGFAVGTPQYMSPEQASGAASVDGRSDIFALGCVLYEMLAGEPPFTGPTAQAIAARRLTEPARPLIAVRSTVPPSVERALLKALERVPADRYPDVAAFLSALRMPGDSLSAIGDPLSEPRGRADWRSRSSLIAAALVALALLGGWLVLRPGRTGAREPDPEVVTLYRRGMAGYERRTPAAIADAVGSLRAALARDSSYAPAWTGLAQVYIRAEERGFPVAGMSRDSMIQAAVAAVDRALALDSANAHAWVARAILSLRVDPTDHEPARRSLQRGFALDSTIPLAWHMRARLAAENGDLPSALRAWHRAVELDPRYLNGLAFLALGFYWHRQFDSAAVWADSVLALDPSFILGRTAAGSIAIERGDYARALSAFDAAKRLTTAVAMVEALAGTAQTKARMGQRQQARALLAQVDSMSRGFIPMPLHTAVYVAEAWAELGEPGPAVRWLEKYDRPRDLHFKLHLRCDPPFDRIRARSDFAALVLGGGEC